MNQFIKLLTEMIDEIAKKTNQSKLDLLNRSIERIVLIISSFSEVAETLAQSDQAADASPD